MANVANVNIMSTTISSANVNIPTITDTYIRESDNSGVEMYNPALNNWTHPFMRSVLSAENGTGSTARLGTLSVVWTTLFALIYLIIWSHKIPDNILSLGYFAALLIVTLYSPLKITDILSSYIGKKR